jgi:hypothetical protein
MWYGQVLADILNTFVDQGHTAMVDEDHAVIRNLCRAWQVDEYVSI